MLGFKLQLRVSASALAQLQDIVQLMMFDGGYIGAIIVEDEIVTIGWVMRRGLLQRIGADWPSQAGYLVRQSALLAELLDGATPEWEKPVAVAAIPYGYLRRQVVSPSIFPIGDQLAVIPSFTGDGFVTMRAGRAIYGMFPSSRCVRLRVLSRSLTMVPPRPPRPH